MSTSRRLDEKQVLDITFDVLDASMDGMCVIVDIKTLETANKTLYTNWLTQNTLETLMKPQTCLVI